jgi:hypothetical protein
MEKYYGYYKCRRCGEKFCRVEMKDFNVAFDNISSLVAGKNPTLPRLYAVHFCEKSDTDAMGLADFIGFEKETNDGRKK